MSQNGAISLLLLVFLTHFCSITNGSSSESSISSSDAKPANILMIMLDDLGRADIGLFGSEWETPNIDSFIQESISLSHHYIGYVCSASRSQFLTGRYSFHNGFGTLDVFDRAKLGGIPQGTPTIADFLKTYSNYDTYAIGKWQLGYSFNEQTPNYRGFDYFWGFYGGLEDYFDKTATVRAEHSDPLSIQNDDTEYFDFWENNEPYYEASGEYSTYQYLTKLTEIIDSHKSNNNDNNDPFFIYAALQAPHMPFPDQDTIFKDECIEKYSNFINNDMSDRDRVCESMLGLDYFMGSLMDYLKTDELKDIYDNLLIIFTSDNGGALDHGSCNYPLRGGKNTYFDGNTRVHTFVGGGIIPDSEQGSVRSGLFSNVDWLPTILSFANIIPNNYYQISWNNEDNLEIPFTFDGYNQYEYIMNNNNNDGSDITPIRDHIVFQLRPSLDDNSNWIANDAISSLNSNTINKELSIDSNDDIMEYFNNLDLAEVAMVFYDENGVLWKYFDTYESTNEIGNVQDNCNWCVLGTDNLYEYTSKSRSVTHGLYDLSTDTSESFNLINNIDDNVKENLLKIVAKNTIQYFINDYSESYIYLYGNFDCFYNKYNIQAWPKYLDGLWAPFLDSEKFNKKLLSDCGFDESHIMYKLHTQSVTMDSDSDNEEVANVADFIIDKTDLVSIRNEYVATEETLNEIMRQEKLYFIMNGLKNANGSKNGAIELSLFVSIISAAVVVVIFGIVGVCMVRCVKNRKEQASAGYQRIV